LSVRSDKGDTRSNKQTGGQMASSFEQANFSGFPVLFTTAAVEHLNTFQDIYEQNRHRIYALSFWMMDNEPAAEELMQRTFRRAFLASRRPSPDTVDRALVTELRELMPLGNLTLSCGDCTEVAAVRRNTKRTHLERAVVQLPPTERMVFLMHDVENYDHARIARNLGLTEDECRQALHQARLRLRELLASMI
jgi:RNA polymerase sigma-70 factor (ECF subfamily)